MQNEIEVGRLPDGTGLSQAEPKVSALRASIPSAEEVADFLQTVRRCELVDALAVMVTAFAHAGNDAQREALALADAILTKEDGKH